jgi:hypothetical protein
MSGRNRRAAPPPAVQGKEINDPPPSEVPFRKRLPPKARPFYDLVLRHRKQRSDEVLWHHRLGRLILDLKKALRDCSTTRRRPGWDGPLAEALDMETSPIYKCCKFAELYTEAEAKEQFQDRGLRWAHVIPLLYVKKKEDRSRLADRAHQDHWTVTQMRDEAERIRGGAQKSGGRKPRLPVSAGAAVDLDRLAQATEDWLRTYTLWEPCGAALLAVQGAPRKQIKSRLDRAVAAVRRLAEAAQALLKAL